MCYDVDASDVYGWGKRAKSRSNYHRVFEVKLNETKGDPSKYIFLLVKLREK